MNNNEQGEKCGTAMAVLAGLVAMVLIIMLALITAHQNVTATPLVHVFIL